MAITATFNPTTGVLSIFGDSLDNSVIVSRNAAGNILVNGGAVVITGGVSTVANTSLIEVFGQAGSDILTLDEANGALPRVFHFGGGDNDTLTGGSGADQLFGQAGNDVVLGKGGNDFLFGGDDNDTLTGGDADDQMFGEAGDDRLIWNPGDDTDLHEGGDGTDTTEVNGGNGAEQFTITANGTRVRFDRLNPAPFSIDMGTMERLAVNMNGGDDQISATGNLAALISITIDGGTGNDTILASNGADVLLGGDGNDFVDGQQGNDIAFLGAGNDTFQWDPGDGSDVVEGQDGVDTLLFNGSAGSENINMAANGGRALFTRDIGNIVMDLDDVEAIRFQAFGGADNITVGDLSATDVDIVVIDLAVAGAGDAQADVVRVDGTSAGDTIEVSAPGGVAQVLGLPAAVQVQGIESIDTMVVRGGGGNDSISASTILAGAFGVTLDGGTGNDSLIGGAGVDLLIGGDGNDVVDGQQGNDVAFLGAGDDVFQWDPGDGSDVVEGQADFDTLKFNGANAGENISIFANGGRAVFFRDVANITMDLDDVERIEFAAFGGSDNITVGDMTGTDVTQVAIKLASSLGGGDGAADRVTVNATNVDDQINVTSAGTTVTVSGLAASTQVDNIEVGDVIVIDGLAGNDVVDASSSAIGLTVNGGLGNDLIVGGNGADFVNGGDGGDVALLGAGNDTFVWNPGDDNDTIEGQDGTDTLLFNGANVSEIIDISANGGRALFFRNVANVLMDMNDVETISFNALGGADIVVVNDLTGTDVKNIRIDLNAAGGAPDGAADTVDIDTRGGSNVIGVVVSGGNASLTGLAVKYDVLGLEAIDRLVVRGAGGNDTLDASTVAAGAVLLTLDGGTGNDNLFGGGGNDLLIGGDGNDAADGGIGADSAFGGAGNDIFVVDNALDLVTENANEGIDTVRTSLNTASLGPNLENLTFIGTGNFGGTGNELNNVITGAAGIDVLSGLLGDDALIGGAGGDTLVGDVGSDTASYLNAAAGVRVSLNGSFAATGDALGDAFSSIENLQGGASKDVLGGDAGANILRGEAGNDELIGGAGGDHFDGGVGIDTVSYDGAAAGVTADLRAPLLGTGDALGDTFISIENMIGSDFDDTLRGTGGDNIIKSGNGDDTVQGRDGGDLIVGASGDDHLLGEGGNDFLTGGAGRDVLIGGLGDDVFDFNVTGESPAKATRDVINDFTVNPAAGAAFVDRIDLSTIDASAALAGDQAFTYIGTGAFTGEGQIRAIQTGTRTLLQINTSGNGGAEMEILLLDFNAADLSLADFIL